MASLFGALLYMLNPAHTALGTRWNKPLVGNMKDKVCVVAGGTYGIGKEAAKQLCQFGATVVLVGRNEERGQETIQLIQKDVLGAAVSFQRVDLSVMEQVNSFSELMTERFGKVDILVNNAMVMPSSATRTPESHETVVALGLYGWYLLTHKMKPLLMAARVEGVSEGARVINVVSAGMHIFKLNPQELLELDSGTGPWKDNYDPVKAYSIVHRARVLLTQRLGVDWASDGITVCSVHPGWVDTPGLRTAGPMQVWYKAMRFSLRSEADGADSIVWLAVAPLTDVLAGCGSSRGCYYYNRGSRRIDLPLSGTAASAEEVEALEQMCEEAISEWK